MLSRKQIEQIRRRYQVWDTRLGQFESLPGIDDVCNMALEALTKAAPLPQPTDMRQVAGDASAAPPPSTC